LIQHQEWNSIEIMPSFNLNIPFHYNKLLPSIRGHPMFQNQYVSFLSFISLSYTIYMLHGNTHMRLFHNMRLKPCLNLSCIHIACFHHVDNQCHILCLVIYMLQPAHMLNKDIRSLIQLSINTPKPTKGLDVFQFGPLNYPNFHRYPQSRSCVGPTTKTY
jgi:hypothetical protein